MFKAMITRVVKNVTRHGGRNACWIKSHDGLFSIGVTQESLNVFKFINQVEITKDNFIKNEHELCFIKSDKFVETIKAPFDCKIVERNHNILETINTDPENKNHSWIVQVEPIIWGQSWKIPLDETIDNYFNNFRNQSHNVPLTLMCMQF